MIITEYDDTYERKENERKKRRGDGQRVDIRNSKQGRDASKKKKKHKRERTTSRPSKGTRSSMFNGEGEYEDDSDAAQYRYEYESESEYESAVNGKNAECKFCVSVFTHLIINELKMSSFLLFVFR